METDFALWFCVVYLLLFFSIFSPHINSPLPSGRRTWLARHEHLWQCQRRRHTCTWNSVAPLLMSHKHRVTLFRSPVSTGFRHDTTGTATPSTTVSCLVPRAGHVFRPGSGCLAITRYPVYGTRRNVTGRVNMSTETRQSVRRNPHGYDADDTNRRRLRFGPVSEHEFLSRWPVVIVKRPELGELARNGPERTAAILVFASVPVSM